MYEKYEKLFSLQGHVKILVKYNILYSHKAIVNTWIKQQTRNKS